MSTANVTVTAEVGKICAVLLLLEQAMVVVQLAVYIKGQRFCLFCRPNLKSTVRIVNKIC